MKDMSFDKNSKIGNKVDINKIMKKVAEKKYKAYTDLCDDFITFAKNVSIASKSPNMVAAANKLVQSVEDEIESLTTCGTCYDLQYQHPVKWFEMSCPEPHLLVWAKAPGFSYWPAKLMKLGGLDDKGEHLLNVRFFEDHTVYDLEAKGCFVFSEEKPVNQEFEPNAQDFEAAIQVTKLFC